MTKTDYELREPYKTILAEIPTTAEQPWVALSELPWDDANEPNKRELMLRLEEAVDEMVAAGVLVRQHDEYCGDCVGFSELAKAKKAADDAEVAEYEDLKSRVFAKAKERGLVPLYKDGWMLVTIHASGGMWEIEKYLDHTAPRKTALQEALAGINERIALGENP